MTSTEPFLKLINEVFGLAAFEQEIREIIGNTNWEVLALRTREARAALSTLPIAGEGKAEPRAWFVKDFADGWIHFDNEADAKRQIEATGAIWYVAHHPALVSSPGKDGGQEVEAVAGPLTDVVAMSASVESKRVLQLHFNRDVTDEDRKRLVAFHNSSRPQPASTALVEAASFLADRLEDFRQKIDDIDDEREFEGNIIPALARLRSALSASTSREGER